MQGWLSISIDLLDFENSNISLIFGHSIATTSYLQTVSNQLLPILCIICRGPALKEESRESFAI